jgi:hypothetical protein
MGELGARITRPPCRRRPGEDDDALPAMSPARRPHCRVRPARERTLTLREAANAFLAQPDLAASSRRSYAQTRTSVCPLSPWAAGEGRSPPRLTGPFLTDKKLCALKLRARDALPLRPEERRRRVLAQTGPSAMRNAQRCRCRSRKSWQRGADWSPAPSCSADSFSGCTAPRLAQRERTNPARCTVIHLHWMPARTGLMR